MINNNKKLSGTTAWTYFFTEFQINLSTYTPPTPYSMIQQKVDIAATKE